MKWVGFTLYDIIKMKLLTNNCKDQSSNIVNMDIFF